MSSCNILIYGPRKSGSSLLQCLLDNEEMFTHPNESKFIGFEKLMADRCSRAVFNRHMKWYFQFEYEVPVSISVYNELFNMLPELKSASDYILLDLEYAKKYSYKDSEDRQSCTHSIIKEVGGNPKSVLESFFKTFKDGKCVFIFRDPRDCASAVFRQRRKANRKVALRDLFFLAYEPYRVMEALLGREGDSRFLFCHYENMTSNPEAVCDTFRTFAELSKAPDPVPTLNGRQVSVKTASQGDGEGKIFIRKNNWWDGLEFRERCVVFIFSVLFRGTIQRLDKLRSIGVGNENTV